MFKQSVIMEWLWAFCQKQKKVTQNIFVYIIYTKGHNYKDEIVNKKPESDIWLAFIGQFKENYLQGIVI